MLFGSHRRMSRRNSRLLANENVYRIGQLNLTGNNKKVLQDIESLLGANVRIWAILAAKLLKSVRGMLTVYPRGRGAKGGGYVGDKRNLV